MLRAGPPAVNTVALAIDGDPGPPPAAALRKVHIMGTRGNGTLSTELLAATEQKMTRTLDAMERDFQQVRIGGASASLLNAIHVDHQGKRTRLIELANVTIPDPRQILIRPWDPSALRAIGAAISQSRIGLTPTIDGPAIRLYVPAMSEERRRELTGLVRKRMDQARVEIRALRHEALAAVRAENRERLVGQDEVHREAALLQRMADRFAAEIDRVGRLKEESLLRM
jgi:ribosome recycling factor